MTNLPTWLVVVLTLAPSVVTVISVLLTLRYNEKNEKQKAKREHATWLRERRYEALTELMDTVYVYNIASWPEKKKEDFDGYIQSSRNLITSTERVRLLVDVEAGKQVKKLTDAIYRASDHTPNDTKAQQKTIAELRVFAITHMQQYDGT